MSQLYFIGIVKMAQPFCIKYIVSLFHPFIEMKKNITGNNTTTKKQKKKKEWPFVKEGAKNEVAK